MANAIELSCGGVRVQLEPDTGYIRGLFVGGVELLRAAYVAVRHADWGTAPNVVDEIELGPGKASWRISSGDFVVWRCQVELTETGLSYSAEGTALRSFETNRTGLCVLHPTNFAASTAVVHHPDGTRSRHEFPISVSPHQPFFDIRRIDVLHSDTMDPLVFEFEGEVFEIEDQRNWSDDSFKTYCRPHAWPKPYPVNAGEVIRHAFRMRWTEPATDWQTLPDSARTDVPAPRVGAMLGHEPLAPWQLERLRAMRLGHLGVFLTDETRAIAEELGIPIQAHFPTRPELLQGLTVTEVFLDLDATPGQIAEVRKATSAPVYAASRHNFTELNRQPPNMDLFDGVAFGIDAQVHAFDDRSILETPRTHNVLAWDAKSIAMGKDVAVAPIRFCQRPDARAQGETGRRFFAASLAQLAGWPVLTYFETHGPNGILSEDEAAVTPLEKAFLAIGSGPRTWQREAEGVRIGRFLLAMGGEK